MIDRVSAIMFLSVKQGVGSTKWHFLHLGLYAFISLDCQVCQEQLPHLLSRPVQEEGILKCGTRREDSSHQLHAPRTLSLAFHGQGHWMFWTQWKIHSDFRGVWIEAAFNIWREACYRTGSHRLGQCFWSSQIDNHNHILTQWLETQKEPL